MRKTASGIIAVAVALALACSMPRAASAQTATVFLDGGNFIQAGSVTNTSGPGIDVTGFIYSLGTPDDGVATFEPFADTASHSDILTDGVHYQTATWGGLSIAPGGVFNFSGLDIDLIVTLTPLDVTSGIIDNVGTSLRNGSVTVLFSNGTSASAPLNLTGWTVNQGHRLQVQQQEPVVPEPGSLAFLVGAGLAGLGLLRRRR